MSSEISRMSEIEKPGEVEHPEEVPKATSLSGQSVDEPIELDRRAQVEIYSSMGRTRTGIWYSPRGNWRSPETWGDRTFAPGDRIHPCAKPQDRGMNPASTELQRSFMGAELGRLRSGQATETGMSEEQLRDFARKKKKRKKRNPY